MREALIRSSLCSVFSEGLPKPCVSCWGEGWALLKGPESHSAEALEGSKDASVQDMSRQGWTPPSCGVLQPEAQDCPSSVLNSQPCPLPFLVASASVSPSP